MVARTAAKAHHKGIRKGRLTIHARCLLGLRIRERVVRWARWLVQTRGRLALHVTGHTRLATRLLLRRRGKPGTTLSTTCHDTLEEIRRTVSDAWRRWLRRTAMLTLRWTAASFELTMEASDLVLVSGRVSQAVPYAGMEGATHCCIFWRWVVSI